MAVGGYVARASLLGLELGQETFKYRDSIFGSWPDETIRHVGIFGRHLAQLEEGAHAALEARLQRVEREVPGSPSDSGRRVELQATLYPQRNIGLAATITKESSDSGVLDRRSIRFGGKVFVTPAISLFLDYEQTDYEDAADSIDRTSFGAAVRF